MTVEEHLEELRYRLLVSLAVVAPIFVILFLLSHPILALVVRSAHPYLKTLVFLSPQEALFTYLKVAMALALVVASPVWLYQALAFILPAFDRRTRRTILRLLVPLIGLFLAGLAFGYGVFLPLVMRFLMGFGGGLLTPMVTVGNYISFVLSVTLPMGVVFEVPMASYVAASLGLVEAATLRRWRRYAILLAFVAAAIFAPPDAFSMLAMAAPMVALYEVAILVAAVTERRRARRAAAEAGAEA
jgi:sec-independent protein translocase protein TatC